MNKEKNSKNLNKLIKGVGIILFFFIFLLLVQCGKPAPLNQKTHVFIQFNDTLPNYNIISLDMLINDSKKRFMYNVDTCSNTIIMDTILFGDGIIELSTFKENNVELIIFLNDELIVKDKRQIFINY